MFYGMHCGCSDLPPSLSICYLVYTGVGVPARACWSCARGSVVWQLAGCRYDCRITSSITDLVAWDLLD